MPKLSVKFKFAFVAEHFLITFRSVTPSFEPTKGSQLAYVQGKQIQVVETVNWSKTVTLKDDKVDFLLSEDFFPEIYPRTDLGNKRLHRVCIFSVR